MINTEGFFKDIYLNAKENSVLLLSTKGVILEVSKSFTAAFGYKNSELQGKHLRVLFTSKDRKLKKPDEEIRIAFSEGSKSDNNYLIQKDGTPIWVVGESVRVSNTEGETFIIKIIHNIHAQKQLERFLLESTDFIDTIFDSIKDTSLLILDSALKVIKVNRAFTKMFDLKVQPEEGSRLSQLSNSFWKDPSLRKQLMDVIVSRRPIKNISFNLKIKGKDRSIIINSKLIDSEAQERKILLVIRFDS
jgi:PAS domain S-box-containing protein